MALVRQDSWHWLVAADLFLAGAGSGQFFTAFILSAQNHNLPLVQASLIMGPLVVAFSALCLIIDAGSKTKALKLWVLISNWKTSWMARGTIILMIFIIFGLAYSAPAIWLNWWYDTFLALGIIAAVFSIFTIIYTAFLLGTSKGMPLWNSPILPPLFIFSALSTGIALIFILAPFLSGQMADGVNVIRDLGLIVVAIVILEIITLAGYLEIGRHQNIAFKESARLLISGPLAPLFIGGLVIIGLVIPVILEVVGISINTPAAISGFSLAVGVLLLIGGYLLRYLILRAGVQVPLYPVTR